MGDRLAAINTGRKLGLVRAFTIFVRSLLEYCSISLSPVHKKDIEALEKVQRRFTMRIPALKDLNIVRG